MRFPTEFPDVVQGLIRIDKADTAFIDDFAEEFTRLERIAQLGVVGEVFRSARHSKLEHTLGSYNLVLRGRDAIPGLKTATGSSREGALRKAMLAHTLGRLPFTIGIENAVAEAAHVSNKLTEEVCTLINAVKAKLDCDACNVEPAARFLRHNPEALHRWFSAWKLIQKSTQVSGFAERWQLEGDGFRDCLRILACPHDEVGRLLRRIDMFDFVPRDFRYAALGSLGVNFEAAVGQLSGESAESRFLTLTEAYLSERLYASESVAILERLLAKLAAVLLTKRSLTLSKLLTMDDDAAGKVLNISRDDLPTLEALTVGVLDSSWFRICSFDRLAPIARDSIETTLGERNRYPFSSDLLLVPAVSEDGEQKTCLFARRSSNAAIESLARLLETIKSAKKGPLAEEQIQSSSRTLAGALARGVLSPGDRMRVNVGRMRPVLRLAIFGSLMRMGRTPAGIIDEIVTTYYEKAGAETFVLQGVAVGHTYNKLVAALTLRRVNAAGYGADHGTDIDSLAEVLLEDPQLVPSDVLVAVADGLKLIRDLPGNDLQTGIAAELKEYLTGLLTLCPGPWVFPPQEFIGQDGATVREIDGIVVDVHAGAKPKVTVLEVSTSEAADKAAKDIGKAGQLVSAAKKRGVEAELVRVARRPIATFRELS